MKRRVDELMRENVNLDPPALLSSINKIELTLKTGSRHQDSFRIGTDEGIQLRGHVYSDNRRILFAQETFSGSFGRIVYGIDANGLKADSVISGNIIIVTNIGEKKIPVTAVVEEKLPQPYEEIKNLENFSRLASTSFREAFLMYTNENFKALLRGKNRKYLPLYIGLSQNPVTYQHLEEFLIAAEKKEQVRISFDKQPQVSYVLNNSIKDTLYIYKSTWGYTRIEILTEGSFIETEKKVITSDDFIGRVYGLEFILNKDKLKDRRNFGRIILKTVYETLVFEIEASPFGEMKLVSSRYKRYRILKLYREFLSLNLRKTDYRTWYENSKKWIDEIKEEEENNFTLLAEAYLAYSQEENVKLIELLWQVKSGEVVLKEPWEKAAYLFLAKEALILPVEKRNIAPRLYAYHRQSPCDYLIVDLYLKQLEDNGFNSPQSMSMLGKLYDMGCRSPFLFLKAWELMERQTALLGSLTEFTVRALLFAQKEGLLSEGLLLRAAFLTSNLKKFYPNLYKLLSRGYEKFGKKEILEAICRHIMNDDPALPDYHKWYERAIEENIRLTRLYEYYIETRPENIDTPLPLPVKLYFSYTMTIGDRKKAYIYACIIKDKENDPIAYENYEKSARDFAYASLKRGRINEFYAVLYNEFFADCGNAEVAGHLSGILFNQRLICRNPDVRRIIVCHTALNDMHSYTVADGVAYPKIYSDDVCILFEDEKRRRFAATVDYELTPLMNTQKLAKACVGFGIWDMGMQLYCCTEGAWKISVSRRNLMNIIKASENVYFTPLYRDMIRGRILSFLVKNSNDWSLLPYAESMKELVYGNIDKEKTFELLINFNEYDKAFKLVSPMGYEGIGSELLIKLATAKIQQLQGEENKDVLRLAYHIYRSGYVNEELLGYISRYGDFDTQGAQELWLKMSELKMDTFYFEEKYLLISMFTLKTSEHSERILENYALKKGNPVIIKAYLNLLSMLYIRKGRELKDYTAKRLWRLCDEDPSESIIRDIAWAKYKAQENKYSKDEILTLKGITAVCCEKNLRFEFFKSLPPQTTLLCGLDDKVFAEESLRAKSEVTISYKISGLNEEGQWKTEPVSEAIPGIYVREFVLFYGESVEYYYTALLGEKIINTAHKTLRAEESSMNGRTGYQLLNRMIMLRSLGAVEKANEVMENYLIQEAFVESMFKLKE